MRLPLAVLLAFDVLLLLPLTDVRDLGAMINSTVTAGHVRVYTLVQALCGLVSVVNYCYLLQLRNYHLPHTQDTFHIWMRWFKDLA